MSIQFESLVKTRAILIHVNIILPADQNVWAGRIYNPKCAVLKAQKLYLKTLRKFSVWFSTMKVKVLF